MKLYLILSKFVLLKKKLDDKIDSLSGVDYRIIPPSSRNLDPIHPSNLIRVLAPLVIGLIILIGWVTIFEPLYTVDESAGIMDVFKLIISMPMTLIAGYCLGRYLRGRFA